MPPQPLYEPVLERAQPTAVQDLTLVTLNHHTTPLAVLAQLALTADTTAALRADLSSGGAEALILATCNRLEVYTAGADAMAVYERLARHTGVAAAELSGYVRTLYGQHAVRHLLRVACGLDSLIVGDQQILGQVRRAYQDSVAADAAGPVLHRVLQRVLAAGKAAKNTYGIDEVSGSLVHAALQLTDPVADRRALVLGSGSMGRLAASALRRAGAAEVLVASRSQDRAERLAQACAGRSVPIEALPEVLAQVDVVITATSAPHHLITPATLAHRAATTNATASTTANDAAGQVLTIIDLALPGDADPALSDHPAVRLITLASVQATGLGAATAATVQAVERVVEAALDQLFGDPASREALLMLRAYIADLEAAEQDWLDGQGLPPEMRSVAGRALSRLAAKFAHQPSVRLTQPADHPQAAGLAGLVVNLFAPSGPPQASLTLRDLQTSPDTRLHAAAAKDLS